MDVPLQQCIIPVQRNIAAYAAVIHQPEGGHQRYAAAQNELVSAEFAQEFHAADHSPGAALPFIAERSDSVQEIELYQVVAPFIQNSVEYPAQVILHTGMIQIKGIEAAPVAAA